MSAGFEASIPGLAELRAAEMRNRALAFAGITHRVCGVTINPLTPHHRLGLQLVHNAFTTQTRPLDGDVVWFLTFLAPGHTGFTPRAAFRRWLLRRHLKRRDHTDNVHSIKSYIVTQLQDQPGTFFTTEDGSPSWPVADYVHWMADEAGFWMEIHGGFTLESYMHTPYLVLQQLFRSWQTRHPKISHTKKGTPEIEPPNFDNASDRLVREHHTALRERIAEAIRGQTERRN
jgi:hypothetical protein